MKQKIFSLLVLIMIAVPEAWATWHRNGLNGLYIGPVTIQEDVRISSNTSVAVLHGSTLEIQGRVIIEDGASLTVTGVGGDITFKKGVHLATRASLKIGGSTTVSILGEDGGTVENTDGKSALNGPGKVEISGSAKVDVSGGSATDVKAGHGGAAVNTHMEISGGNVTVTGGYATGSTCKGGNAFGEGGKLTLNGGNVTASGGGSGGGGTYATALNDDATVNITASTGVTISGGPSSDDVQGIVPNNLTPKIPDMIELLAQLKDKIVIVFSAPPIPDYNHCLIYNNDDTKGAITFTVGEDDSKVENATTAKEEEQVFVTVTPVDGYAVDEVTACTFNNFENAGARRRAPSDGIPLLGDEVTLEPVQGQANTWNFGMPPSSVLVSVTYKKQAAFETQGGNQLAPTAVEGVIAGEDKAIVSPGTVADVSGGTGPQGEVWYFFTNDGTITADQIPTDGWSKDLPTAAGFTGDTNKDVSVYVWYYIEATSGSGYANSTPVCLEIKLLKNLFAVKMADPTDAEAANWKIHSGDNSEPGNVATGLTGLKAGAAVDLVYSGRLKVKSVTATTDAGAPAEEPVTLATPLTMEAITPGTIVVNMNGTLSTGMKYSVNGGTKTTITNTTSIEGLKAGDKVQFYGNGAQTQVYGNSPEVKILGSGDGFQTKVYGNIMSLLDEEGFAMKTDLPNGSYVFYGLFKQNTTLIDASELLLPAATLALNCYQSMFQGCSNLTTAPKLPATTLANSCYNKMFYDCTKLTSAYVKAAYTVDGKFSLIFNGCSATGAILHTTSDNKASWEAVMGTGNIWPNWSVADDWQD